MSLWVVAMFLGWQFRLGGHDRFDREGDGEGRGQL